MAWLKIYSGTNQGDEKYQFDFQGRLFVANLAGEEHIWPNGQSLNDNIRSLECGPETWVTLYEDTGYRGRYENYFPNDAPGKIFLSKKVSSIKIYDSPPGWSPPQNENVAK